jgi:uncharacterized protein YecT (DUF1311 family)
MQEAHELLRAVGFAWRQPFNRRLRNDLCLSLLGLFGDQECASVLLSFCPTGRSSGRLRRPLSFDVKAHQMKHYLPVLLSLVLSGLVLTAQAQEDIAVGCPGPDTSSMFESCVLEKQRVASEAKLQELYQIRLKSAHSKNVVFSLRAAQKEWEKYRDLTCQFEQAEYGGINSINFVRCNERMTAERVRYFEDLR